MVDLIRTGDAAVLASVTGMAATRPNLVVGVLFAFRRAFFQPSWDSEVAFE
jgi:hypothetical protein